MGLVNSVSMSLCWMASSFLLGYREKESLDKDFWKKPSTHVPEFPPILASLDMTLKKASILTSKQSGTRWV